MIQKDIPESFKWLAAAWDGHGMWLQKCDKWSKEILLFTGSVCGLQKLEVFKHRPQPHAMNHEQPLHLSFFLLNSTSFNSDTSSAENQ